MLCLFPSQKAVFDGISNDPELTAAIIACASQEAALAIFNLNLLADTATEEARVVEAAKLVEARRALALHLYNTQLHDPTAKSLFLENADMLDMMHVAIRLQTERQDQVELTRVTTEQRDAFAAEIQRLRDQLREAETRECICGYHSLEPPEEDTDDYISMNLYSGKRKASDPIVDTPSSTPFLPLPLGVSKLTDPQWIRYIDCEPMMY
jgi:hypothetical protein